MKIEIDDEVRVDTDCECEFKKRYIHDHLELNRVWDAVRSLRTQLWEKKIELSIAKSAYNNLALKLNDVEQETQKKDYCGSCGLYLGGPAACCHHSHEKEPLTKLEATSMLYSRMATLLYETEKENKILNDKVKKLEDTIRWAVSAAKSYMMWSKLEGTKFCSEAFRYDVMRRAFGEKENK